MTSSIQIIKKEIGKNIKKYRKRKNFTQQKLSEITNISKSSLRNYEQGRYQPDSIIIKGISIALEVSLEKLLESKEYTRQKLIDNAEKYLDTPWQHNQSVINSGIDCLRFWEKIARESGINLPALPDSYGRSEPISKIQNFLETHFTPTNDLTPGNLLLFNYQGSPHLGMVYKKDKHGYTQFIHASNLASKVTINRLTGKYLKRWCNTYRIV